MHDLMIKALGWQCSLAFCYSCDQLKLPFLLILLTECDPDADDGCDSPSCFLSEKLHRVVIILPVVLSVMSY